MQVRPTRRFLRLPVVALCLVLATGFLVVPSSQAVPSRDLQQVAAQVRDLQMQAAGAHEDAERARLKLEGVRSDLSRIEQRRERERAEMRITMGTIADIARNVYTNGGMDPTLQVLLAEDPAEFLAQAAVMDQLTQTQAAQLREVQTNRLRLAQTEAEISDRETIAQQARDEMAAAEAQVEERLGQAQQLLDQLQEEERQRLLALQQARNAEQREQARQAAAALAASSVGTQDASGAAQAGGGFSGGSRAAAAIQYALAQVGDPYSYSANPPSSWDCSKLTAAAWAQAGVSLTALSYTQFDQTRRVPVSEIQPGDLVFYFGSGAHHVGMYIGGGKMVHAANPSDGVEVTDFLGPWYGERFSGVGRVIG